MPVSRAISDLPSAKVLHATFRDYIKHEDTLVQYRITWLLVLTGMLLTTYLTLYGLMLYVIVSAPEGRTNLALVDYNVSTLLFVPIFLLSVIGLVASATCFRSIVSATAAARSIRDAWTRFKDSRHWQDGDRFLPDVTFGFSKAIAPTYGYPKAICVAIALLWLLSTAANVFLLAFFGLVRSQLGSP